jgi:hypothetical protein
MSSLIDFDGQERPEDGNIEMIEPVRDGSGTKGESAGGPVEKKSDRNLKDETKSEKTDEEKRRDLMAEVRPFPFPSLSPSFPTLLPLTSHLSHRSSPAQHMNNPKTNTSQKASALRTRLQLALYKVQTNQTSTPFMRLRPNSTKSPRPRSPQLPPMSSSPMSSPPRRHWRAVTMSPESKIAIARAKATMGAKPVVRNLDDIAHPTIAPGALSARNMNANVRGGAGKRVSAGRELSSSPPMSNEHDAGAGDAGGVIVNIIRPSTPSPAGRPSHSLSTEAAEAGSKDAGAAGKEELPSTPKQLSSPPGSPELGTTVKKLRARDGMSLTSSVVKAGAAEGLMELMRGGVGQD